MGRYCVVCLKILTKQNKISLHAFPKDIVQRSKWLNFCQMDERKINTVTMLCNKHFKVEDFLYNVRNNKLILKKDAIPSIMSNKCRMRLYQEMTSSNNANNTNLKLLKKDLFGGFENLDNNKIDAIPETNNEESVSVKIEEPELNNDETLDGTLLVQNNVVENISPKMVEESTLKSLKIRYVGDINESHLATPRRAKQALDKAMMQITEQRKKIKTLQRASNRYKKKIKSLKNLLRDK